MEQLDLTLIRILLKQLCKEPTDEESISGNGLYDAAKAGREMAEKQKSLRSSLERAISGVAPGSREQRDVVRAHHQLLVDKGLAEIVVINMQPRRDVPVLVPTDHGTIWCRYAYDDQQWEQHIEELRSILLT